MYLGCTERQLPLCRAPLYTNIVPVEESNRQVATGKAANFKSRNQTQDSC